MATVRGEISNASGTNFNSKIRIEIIGTNIAIEDLDIDFEITMSSEQNPNEAVITIYNLSTATKKVLQDDATGIRILYKYHYEKDFQIIYEGYKRFKTKTTKGKSGGGKANRVINTEINGADVATIIECAENNLDYSSKVYSASISAGTTTEQIINNIALLFGTPVEYTGNITHLSYINGLVINESAKSALSTVCDRIGANWSFLFGILYITSIKSPVPSEIQDIVEVHVLTSQNSEPPEYEDDYEVNIKTVLTPSITPKSFAKLEMKEIQDTYKVIKSVHVGSNNNGDNYSSITVKENEPPKDEEA